MDTSTTAQISSARVNVAVGFLSAAFAICALMGNAVFAEEQSVSSAQAEYQAQPGALEEIVVTAQKRSENVRDIPASVVAISAATIADAHLTRIDDIGTLVSNLNIVTREDSSPDVTLRGVGSFGVVEGVGFYVNDVQIFEGQTVRPYDLERIEVLKGPQGTLYGGANIGGAIKYITKDPSWSWSNEATAEAGNYNTRNYFAAFSGPIVDETLAMRASFYDEKHDGYIYDTYRKYDYGNTGDHGGRFTFLYQPDTNLRVHLNITGDDYSTGAQNLLYTPPDDHTYLYSVNDFYIPSFIRRFWSPSLQADYQLSDAVALTSISSFFSSYGRGFSDLGKRPIPFDYHEADADHRVITQELRLVSVGAGAFEWLLGAFFQRHRTELTSINNYSTRDVNNPIVVATDLDRDEKTQKQYAIFGDASYSLQKWRFELGLRGEYYDNSEYAYDNAVVPTLSGYAQVTGHRFSPRFSVQYKFTPQVNAYATFAQGFEPSDEAEENGVIHSYRPEIVTSYEVGVKSEIEDRVKLNAAIFYIDYKDRLYTNQEITSAGLIAVTTNVGPSHNYGAEADVEAGLGYGFKLSAGFGVTRAVWGNAPYIDPQTSELINLNGRTAPFTPAYTGNVVLQWMHALRSGYTIGARADASFTGRSWWDPQDSAKQDAYHLVNVGAQIGKDAWTVSAHVSNLTQTAFNTIYGPSYDVGIPLNVAHVNQPRETAVSVTVRF